MLLLPERGTPSFDLPAELPLNTGAKDKVLNNTHNVFSYQAMGIRRWSPAAAHCAFDLFA